MGFRLPYEGFPNSGTRIVKLENLNAFMLNEIQSGNDPNKIHWALVDDATYSGMQIQSHAVMVHYWATENSFEPIVDVVVPYHTNRAKKYLEGYANLYSINLMPSVDELVPPQKKRLFSGSLIIFQHKIADSQSFDHNIRRGWVFAPLDENGRMAGNPKKINFITENLSPYPDSL
ncbi:MAG: hypothetical protein HUU56_14890 [Bdellovibrionaceae bacterium]|nr:hypothetical protein [Pseudobdellovibrionaceae bacterium]